MPLPRSLGRFNRRVTNPLLGPIVGKLPGYGYLIHVGRRSGRRYRTPVLAFRRGDRIVLALTYGPGADWVANIAAAGGCRLELGRTRLELAEPRLFHDPARSVVPAALRPVLRLLRSADFLELRVRSSDATQLQGTDARA